MNLAEIRILYSFFLLLIDQEAVYKEKMKGIEEKLFWVFPSADLSSQGLSLCFNNPQFFRVLVHPLGIIAPAHAFQHSTQIFHGKSCILVI